MLTWLEVVAFCVQHFLHFAETLIFVIIITMWDADLFFLLYEIFKEEYECGLVYRENVDKSSRVTMYYHLKLIILQREPLVNYNGEWESGSFVQIKCIISCLDLNLRIKSSLIAKGNRNYIFVGRGCGGFCSRCSCPKGLFFYSAVSSRKGQRVTKR